MSPSLDSLARLPIEMPLALPAILNNQPLTCMGNWQKLQLATNFSEKKRPSNLP